MPSSSAPAVLDRQPTESAAARRLLAIQGEEEQEQEQEQEQEDDDGFIDIEAFDNEALIDPQLRSTTQIGISRIEESFDAYCPGTLPPRLYQANPFSKGQEDNETDTMMHQLTPEEMAPTVEELQAIADKDEDE